MSEPQKKKRINIPDNFDATARELIGQKIVDRVLERTAEGLDINGNKFKSYSDGYANSLEFKIAGKSKNDVNLRLTGDTLDSLSVLEHGPGYILVGYNEGTAENDKAFWSEAQDKEVKRNFLGVSPNELELIIAEVQSSQPRTLSGLVKQELVVKGVKDATKSAIDNILKRFYLDSEGD